MELATRPLLRRLLALDRLLRGHHYPNARTAAQELEVHLRTLHRDLEFLRDSLGVPLEFCRRHNGYYYRDADYGLPFLRLTEGELEQVRAAAQHPGQQAQCYARDGKAPC
jgi:predicted DNA-binding transcriptional regulator YafY